MICPECGYTAYNTGTMGEADKPEAYRRYTCKKCRLAFWTLEYVLPEEAGRRKFQDLWKKRYNRGSEKYAGE